MPLKICFSAKIILFVHLFISNLGLNSAAFAEGGDVVIVEGDTNGVFRLGAPHMSWFEYQTQQLRNKGYRVVMVREAELPVLQKIISSPDTLALIYHGHSVTMSGEPYLSIRMGTKILPIDRVASRVAQLVNGQAVTLGENNKANFLLACSGNRCSESQSTLKIDGKAWSFDGEIGTDVYFGSIVRDSVDEAFQSGHKVGSWIDSLPLFRGRQGTVDWDSENKRLQRDIWNELGSGLQKIADLSPKDLIGVHFYLGPIPDAFAENIYSSVFKKTVHSLHDYLTLLLVVKTMDDSRENAHAPWMNGRFFSEILNLPDATKEDIFRFVIAEPVQENQYEQVYSAFFEKFVKNAQDLEEFIHALRGIEEKAIGRPLVWFVTHFFDKIRKLPGMSLEKTIDLLAWIKSPDIFKKHVHTLLAEENSREGLLNVFKLVSERLVLSRGDYHSMRVLLREAFPGWNRLGLDENDRKILSNWLEKQDRKTCPTVYSWFRNFQKKNRL